MHSTRKGNQWHFGIKAHIGADDESGLVHTVITTAANVIFLQYTAPVWMFLMSIFLLKEPVDRRSLVALGFGAVGIVVIVGGGLNENPLGIGLALVAGITYGGIAVFLRALRQSDPYWLTVLNLGFSGAVLVPLLYFIPGAVPLTSLTISQFSWLLVFGVVQMGIPYILFAKSLGHLTPQEAGILTLLEPALNPVCAYLAVGEMPSVATIIGGAIILCGLVSRYFPFSRPGVSRD